MPFSGFKPEEATFSLTLAVHVLLLKSPWARDII